MTAPTEQAVQAPSPLLPQHPLDPLTTEEIMQARTILSEDRPLPATLRYALVMLHEPPKSAVLAYQAGDPLDRQAFLVLLDKADGTTYEAIVSLTERKVHAWHAVVGQPPILLEEFVAVSEIVKADPAWRAAVQRRGVTDVDLVQLEPFSAGQFGFANEQGRRLVRAIAHARLNAHDNGFAHPIEGLIAYVDLNAREVLHLVDEPAPPIPWQAANYDATAIGEPRADLKPLQIVQSAGPSFTVQGHEVAWQKWRFRVALNPREGLVLYTVTYDDQGRRRPILYRASISEMVVPYADPSPGHFWRTAFDAGEYGLGKLANSLELGCDCLGEIHYFAAACADDLGAPFVIKNAICLHEEDAGVLWKHYSFRDETYDVRRSRRLVVSFFATIGNYDYGFYWYFYQDGTIQCEVKLTGIMLAAAAEADYRYGTPISPGLAAPHHQHLFSARLDFMVDGVQNAVQEVDVVSLPSGPDNQYGNAFTTQVRLLTSELEAQRMANPLAGRSWQVINRASLNALGCPVAYKLVPSGSPPLLAQPDAAIARRAAFATKHLWVTRYDPAERYAAGEYPNQHPGGAGLPAWTQADREIVDQDIVVWHTFGSTHLTRAEDWPVMPVELVGFVLKPVGFFDRNPGLDVPKPESDHCQH